MIQHFGDRVAIKTKIFEKYKMLNKKPLKIFYKILVPQSIRDKINLIVDFNDQQIVEDNWCELIEEYKKNKEEIDTIIKTEALKKLDNEKIIWQYWNSGWGNNHPIIELSKKSIDMYKGNYIVIRLDDNNFHKYIKFPDYIIEKKKKGILKTVFFSDILRLALLKHYGGIWLDSTVFLSGKIPDKYLEKDFFVFQRCENESDKKLKMKISFFNCDRRCKIKALSSIIFSRQNNPFISDLLNFMNYYWFKNDETKHYFFFQILYNTLITKYNYETCEVVDDTIPHILQFKMNRKFNKEEYYEIINTTSMHKLNYKKKFRKKKYNYYKYLLNEYNINDK